MLSNDVERLYYSHREQDAYLNNYFEAYLESEELEQAIHNNLLEPHYVADNLLKKPIIYNVKSSSQVFIPANEKVSANRLADYSYFPCYEVKISRTNVVKNSIPKPNNLNLIHNIREFPKFNMLNKNSSIRNVSIRKSQLDILAIKPSVNLCVVENIENPLLKNTGVESCDFPCFITSIEVVGNLALFNIICNDNTDFRGSRYIESFPSLSFCNSAIAQGYDPASSLYSGLPNYSISIPLHESPDCLSEEEIRRCKNEALKRIKGLELSLKVVEYKFNLKDLETRVAIINRIESLRKQKLDSIQDEQFKASQDDAFKKLLNDF